ncbi:extracellular solute-binding protein [Paenibacillus hodogayensis]|uniref:Extracellular solute-binding protein n=1 Tax=Paenibacillus hodogayensis TaxID=279208 RepID=A0ABV5VYS7_9BACL
MRRGWKSGLAAAVLLPAIGMLAGACGKNATETQLNSESPEAGKSPVTEVTKEPVELTYLVNPGGLNQADFEKNINQQVRKKYPNFTIKPLEMLPQDAIATKTNFDFTGGSFTTIGTLVDLGITTDMEVVLQKYGANLDRFEPNLLKSIREADGGKLFGLPYYANHQVMFYNKDLFDKFGAPYPKDNMTYEETLEIARKMTRTEGGTTYRGFAGDLNSILGQNRYAASVVDPATTISPLAGAIVSPAGYPAIGTHTDSGGNFVLTQVPAGKRWIKAFKPGYEFAVSDAVYVPAGQEMTAAITLKHRSPLVLTDATRIGVRTGEAAGATSSADGMLYLVPSGTAATRAAIEVAGAAASGRSTPVTGSIPATMDTEGLPDGLYTLYAIDFEGVVSDGSEPLAVIDPLAPPDIIDSGSPLVRYSGSWMNYVNAQNYGGSSMQARDKDAYVEIAFYGSRATVYSLVGSARGIADVYVDGQRIGELDTYYPSVRYQHPTYDSGPLQEGVHQIRFVVTGRKRQSSTNYFVNFDVLRVMGE